MSKGRRRQVRTTHSEGSWRLLLTALALMGIGSVLVIRAGFGMLTRTLDTGPTPLSFWIASPQVRAEWHLSAHPHDAAALDADHPPELVPGVIVVHGTAASQRIMLGYAHSLAASGYGVMLLDIAGHGGNVVPLSPDAVQEDIDRAYRELVRQPEVDATRIGLIGHSLGGGAVLRAASAQPDRYLATVAISAVPAPVSVDTPRNLQLQAGGWEGGFVNAAREMLQQAGGESGDFSSGRARQLVIVPAADHLGILFRDASQRGARDWLDLALQPDLTQREPYRDLRAPGWLLFVAGTMVLVRALAPAFARPSGRIVAPAHALAALTSPFLAAVLVAGLLRLVDPDRLLGMPVAGTVGLWLGIAGLLIIAAGVRLQAPRRRQLAWAAGLFAFLWLAVGMSAELVWLQWTLVGARVWRFLALSIACLPWFVALAACQQLDRRPAWAWWLGTSLASVGGALLLATMVPGLGLLHLILPLLPLFFAITTITATRTNDPWAAGVGNALFFGWLLASAFPLIPSI